MPSAGGKFRLAARQRDDVDTAPHELFDHSLSDKATCADNVIGELPHSRIVAPATGFEYRAPMHISYRWGPAATVCALALVASLVVALVVPASAEPAARTTLRLGNAGEPQTLDPHRYNLRLEETILNDLFVGLTTFNARGELSPGAARAWEASADGLTWTFELREDLRWSDGTALTADDFVYAFRRLLDPVTAASLAYFMYPLANAEAVNAGDLPVDALGVSAPGPHTLVLELAQPYPHLLERLLYPTAYPVPRHVIEEHGDSWVKPGHWVSNGAYRLDAWQPQAHVKLVANEHYHEPAHVQELYYYPLASEQNAYNRYRAGDLDAISTFPAGELEDVRAEMPEHLRVAPQLSIIYLVFNTREPPFDDVRVREALALAVQPEVITDRVQKSGNVPSRSFVPALVGGYDPVPAPHYALTLGERMTRARALLAEAGYGPDRPLEITLRYISGNEAKRTSLATSAFWKALGVQVSLHHSELKVHFTDLRQGDFQVAQAGWIGENNAEHYLGLLVSDTGDVNYGGFADARYDELMAHARTLADPAARNAALRAAEAHVVHAYPVVPLYSISSRRLVSPALEGWHENHRDAHPARYLSLER